MTKDRLKTFALILLGIFILSQVLLYRVPFITFIDWNSLPFESSTWVWCSLIFSGLVVLASVAWIVKYELSSTNVLFLTAAVALTLPMICVALLSPVESYRDTICKVSTPTVMGLLVGMVLRPRWWIPVLSVPVLAQLLISLIIYKSGGDLFLSGNVHRAGGTFKDPNQLYTLTMIYIALCLPICLDSKMGKSQVWILVATALSLSCLTLTWYRSGVLGLAASIMFVAWRMQWRPRNLVIAFLICSAFVFFCFHHRSADPVSNASTQRSNNSRGLLWRRGIEVFKQHSLTGVGPSNLAVMVTTETADPEVMITSTNHEVKNILLFYFCELGLLGGLLLIALFFAAFRTVLQSVPSPLSIGIGSAWVAILLAGVADTPFGPSQRYVGNCLFGLLCGMTIGLHRHRSTT